MILIPQIEKDSLHFKGLGGPDKAAFELSMKLLKEVDPEATKYQVKPRCIEFALEKVGGEGRGPDGVSTRSAFMRMFMSMSVG